MNRSEAAAQVRRLMQELDPEPAHVLRVAGLALEIFDDLQSVHQLKDTDRFILESAALLHDIGWSAAPDGRRHHKESARIIRERSWKDLEAHEVGLIALVARYHRRSVPLEQHDRFAALESADRRRVEVLAGILRVADGLDRRHIQCVSHVQTTHLPGRLLLTLTAKGTPDQEILAATKKGALLASALGVELGFVVEPEGEAAH